MISITRREALYTAGLFAVCSLGLVLPHHPFFDQIPPLIAIFSGAGALTYLLHATDRPIHASSTKTAVGTDHPR